MSCDVAAAGMLFLASLAPAPKPASAPAYPQLATGASAVADEPLFRQIVRDARTLAAEVKRLDKAAAPDLRPLREQVPLLAAEDLKAHLLLAKRGTDGDLKCILKGISQDLPLKLAALEAAASPTERHVALADLGYLLRDNVEVILAPPAPPV
jgi:hypothetical protein